MESSESDDDLEDTPDFIKNASPTKNSVSSVPPTPEKVSPLISSPAKPNKLDLLLSEQRKENEEEAKLKKTKDELLKKILDGSQEEDVHNHGLSDSLAEEHADHIEQLELKPSALLTVQPGLHVFSADKSGQLFDENLTLNQCGFKSKGSTVDTLLAAVTPDTLMQVSQSKVMVTCADQISSPDTVKLWLLYVLSVHRSAVIQHMCYNNLMEMLQRAKLKAASPHGSGSPQGSGSSQDSASQQGTNATTWCPSTLEILKLLVNLGAEANALLGDQTLYSADEISQALSPMTASASARGQREEQHKKLCTENFGLVLNVLSVCLQSRPKISKEELNWIFYMIAKTSLDTSLQNCLQRELMICLSSLVELYSETDWPAVVPGLCRSLSGISDHHHDQAYLVELLKAGNRGEYLQAMLGYMFLRLQLSPDIPVEDSDLLEFGLIDVAWLGHSPAVDSPSVLTESILELVDTDLYRVSSLLRLLDLTVGGNRKQAAQPKDQLEYLLGQVKLAIKGIRDSIFQQDHSKIKDTLSRLKVKWSLTCNNQRKVQRSMFAYATATSHQAVLEEKLKNFVPTEIDDDVDDL